MTRPLGMEDGEARPMVRISPLAHLSTHTRFTIILRTLHPPITYHTLLLFRLSPVISIERERRLTDGQLERDEGLEKNPSLENRHYRAGHHPGKDAKLDGPPDVQLYCMESTCPHLGAPLSHAELTTSQQIDVATCDHRETGSARHDRRDGERDSSDRSSSAGHPGDHDPNRDPTPDPDPDPDPDPFLPELLSITSLSDPLSYDISHTPLLDSEKKTIICPWHLYDFDLEDGGSSTGMGVCVYRVEVKRGERQAERLDGRGGEASEKRRCRRGVEVEVEGDNGTARTGREVAAGWDVWIEAPEHESQRPSGNVGWEVVSVTGVSEEFADPPIKPNNSTISSSPPIAALSIAATSRALSSNQPLPDLPKTLVSAALLILQTPSASRKLELTKRTLAKLRSGGFSSIKGTKGDHKAAAKLFTPLNPNPEVEGGNQPGLDQERRNRGTDMPNWPGHFVPPREDGVKTVDPGVVGKRGRGGNEKSRVLMLHALANIEQWAIDLSWDIIARFADFSIGGEKLPVEFFLDWAKVAEDEAKHFSLLSRRLEELGSHYGAHTVHAGLWTSALETSHSLLSRLAIIHLVAEARGLDVNPLTIEKFRKAADGESVRVLEIIHSDEITHVTTGHRWFTWICQRMNVDPVTQFREEVRHNFRGRIKGPFNTADRLTAGMGNEYYEDLEGEMVIEKSWGKKELTSGEFGRDVPEGRTGMEEGDLRIHPRLT